MRNVNLTKWSDYVKGEVTTYNWRLNKVQVLITESYFINNFVDHACDVSSNVLNNVDKIILIGNGQPIALYPKDAEDLNVIKTYLESIKNTDIHTILIAVVDNGDMFVDSEAVEDTLAEIKSVCKMKVRYLLRD